MECKYEHKQLISIHDINFSGSVALLLPFSLCNTFFLYFMIMIETDLTFSLYNNLYLRLKKSDDKGLSKINSDKSEWRYILRLC